MPTGRDLVRLAERHLGERYVLGAPVPKDDPSWTGPWDCAEFASWLVYQVAGYLYGCDSSMGNPATAEAYSGWWARDAEKIGRQIGLSEASSTPGAFVIRRPVGKIIGHVALCTGSGGTIEAHSAATGVIRSQISGRRWDHAVLIPGCDFKAQASITLYKSPGVILRLATPPMRGELVKQVQQALSANHFSTGPIDGVFGPYTAAAVAAFQAAEGLVVDGEVGPSTLKALKLLPM